MASKFDSDLPSPPAYDDSDREDNDTSGEIDIKQEKENNYNGDVLSIIKQNNSSAELLNKPKQEYYCRTCELDFSDWYSFESHTLQHVSLPSIVLDKLPSEDENSPSGDENWSDEENDSPAPPAKTPQKLDISQILNKTGLSIKMPSSKTTCDPNSALNKLSGLGFTIKKSSAPTTPIKQEKTDDSVASNVMKKIDNLGGIKIKLKSDGINSNSFKVVNGLKDFKTSDDEDEDVSENEDNREDKSGDEHESADEQPSSRKSSISDDISKNQASKNSLVVKNSIAKTGSEPIVNAKQLLGQHIQTPKTQSRPAVKQTPKRGPNIVQTSSTPILEKTLERKTSSESEKSADKVVIKQEVDADNFSTQPTREKINCYLPLVTETIKSERKSPSLDQISTPIIATIKSEPETTSNLLQPVISSQPTIPISANGAGASTFPLMPVTKKEDTGVTIIEINGDSNDEDDDCCVVSATPAPDVKPVIPKQENAPPPPYPTPPVSSYSSPQSTNFVTNHLSSRLTSSTTPSTEKQHNFNWNAPDSKPPLGGLFDKSADDIFESLLSTSTKKESLASLSDPTEYISLDTLGAQHSCEVCNTRFTDLSLLEEHRRTTGHLQLSQSSSLMPYAPTSNIISSLLPVKQLAEHVGKLSTINSGPGFTHQQNVMINIQAYPGAGGVMSSMPPQYNSYAPGQTYASGYPPHANNPNDMYGSASQSMPNQYPGANYMGPQSNYGQQFQPNLQKTGFPSSSMPQSPYGTPTGPSPYSANSPLQNMQSMYGQGGTNMPQVSMGQQMGAQQSHQMNAMDPNQSHSAMGQQQHNMGPQQQHSMAQQHPMGQMGPPAPPMMAGNTIKIQNVQTFPPPGQISGQNVPGASNQIRMSANIRQRMPSVKGVRPTLKPGLQVHGQVRGMKPAGNRMPLKRNLNMVGGPGQKRRQTDMLLPGKHDNDDCHVMSLQKQRDGLPMIQSVQGAKDKLNIGSQISFTKKTVNKEANAMANVLASRGISIKQKQKSRSPSPQRPLPHIPNLGAGVSIKHTSKSNSFSIPESKVGGGMLTCKICKKMFMNQTSLSVHMGSAHPSSKIPVFKCDECPASYPKSLQLQHHKRVFHNVTGPNRELGLPVVDLSQEENLKRLSSLGIYSFIPLANREQPGGHFGIPILSVHNAHNGMTNSLHALGADGLLSLGPLKTIPNS